MKAAAKKIAPVTKASLAELTAQWARAKVMEETARREAEQKRREILEAGATIGYADEHLVIGEFSSIDLDSTKLLRSLERSECLEDAYEKRLSIKKLRALAELKPAVAEALEACTEKSPRFEQAARKR